MTAETLVAMLQGRPLLRRKDVAGYFGITLRTVDRWKAEGRLPKPDYVHGPMWRPADIERIDKGGGK